MKYGGGVGLGRRRELGGGLVGMRGAVFEERPHVVHLLGIPGVVLP